MRVRSWQMLTLILLLGIGYVCIFHWDFVKGLWEKAVEKGKGYGTAEKPQEAIDYLNKALEAREYKYAKKYLSGDYGNELGKIADEAEQLAKAIDNIREAMKEHKIQGDAEIDSLLMKVEYFPKRFEKQGEIVQAGDNKAMVRLVPVFSLRGKVGVLDAALTKEGDEWRIGLPPAPALFALIKNRGRAYANAIEKVDQSIKGRDMTAGDVRKELNDELIMAERGQGQ